ncbi:type I glutamate--ammonia ligase [Candidatus Bathyarchaeota archaeon]|nr:type I glutamate--ammonia ligase [Candidatus Bathyarchaeota archaeon]MBS7631777.1 type I glutamate--ammonia ligase [Candidatus Bathyarchaeota archaeon]
MTKKHDIKYIRLMVIDLNGRPRAMLIPEYELESALTYGIGFDGSSIAGFMDISQSDLVANPDPSTFLIPMWEAPGIAIMFCYISTPEGRPFEGDPRGLLKKTLDELEERNYGFNTGPELEYFYVTRQNRSIKPYDSGSYFDLPPIDPSEEIKMETMMCLEAAGFQLDKVHHEVAAGQHEINFRYSDALKTADNIILYKLAVKTIAQKYNSIATFMPKPFWGVNGSGCHIHMSLVDLATGENLFHDPKANGLSETASYFIGGILSHSEALSMIVAPTVNSYKRLVPYFEAPVYVCWGYGNRSAIIRVPKYPKGVSRAARIEYRHPDPACNPYLASVAILKAGLDGIERKIDPGDPIPYNIYHLSKNEIEKIGLRMLPEHLSGAVEAFSSDDVISKFFGECSKNLVQLKEREFESYENFVKKSWEESRSQITPWEIEQYLVRC